MDNSGLFIARIGRLEADRAALLAALNDAVTITENYIGAQNYKARMTAWLDDAVKAIAKAEVPA